MGPNDPNEIYDLIWCEVDKCHYCVRRVKGVTYEQLKEHFAETLWRVSGGSALTLAGTNAPPYLPQEIEFARIDITESVKESIKKTNDAYQKYMNEIRKI